MESNISTNPSAPRIATRRCTGCGRPGPTVLLGDAGALCAGCAPDEFEAVARRDVDDWLSGGGEASFGRE